MSIQICRAVELMMRSAGCQTIRSRTLLAPVGPACLSLPWAPVPHRQAYSQDRPSAAPGLSSLGLSSPQPLAEKTSPSSALSHRKLSAVALQGQLRALCQYDFLDLRKVEENLLRAKSCKSIKQFIVDPDLAKLIVQLLETEDDTPILEFNPGPGVLTKTLLNAGARRVVALETDSVCLKQLRALEGVLNGQLKVIHCNFIKIDPLLVEHPKPPLMFSDELFMEMGISEAEWTDDIPVKIVGILPISKDRNILLRMLNFLFRQQSIFRYGRIEFNFFVGEKGYQSMVARPGEMKVYNAFSVLMQMAFEINLLHQEPCESFAETAKFQKFGKRVQASKGNMYLVRLRPRADLFSTGLTTSNAAFMMMMVKQCMVKKKIKLSHKLNIWHPESARKFLSELGISEDRLTGQVYPEEYLRLFLLMDKTDEFRESWLFEESLERYTQRVLR